MRNESPSRAWGYINHRDKPIYMLFEIIHSIYYTPWPLLKVCNSGVVLYLLYCLLTPLVSDLFPTNVQLKYIPYTKEHDDITSCASPVIYDLKKELPGKKIVITGAPGAFTPTCTEQHIPGYLESVQKFKAKGVDKLVILTANDPFVNAAWGKALGYKDEENFIIFATDPNGELSKSLGDNYVVDLSKAGFGLRTNRYAAIIDAGKVQFLENEDAGGFTDITKAESLLSKL